MRARVQCTMVGALHHSGSWLDRPWLWGLSRYCRVRSNCALLRKGFCIPLMDYSPTSPVRVDSVDRQTPGRMQTCTRALPCMRTSTYKLKGELEGCVKLRIFIYQINITIKHNLLGTFPIFIVKYDKQNIPHFFP